MTTYPDPKTVLIEAIKELTRYEGHDAELLAADIIDHLRKHDILLSFQYERVWKREAEAAKAARAAAATTLPEYHGVIKQCQARVTDMSNSRWPQTNRCSKKPTKVRWIEERHGSYKGDGRLAVCGIHAKAQDIGRWVKTDHWQDKHKTGTADEVVEPEYQP